MNKYKQRLFREAMKFKALRASLIGGYNMFTKNPFLESYGKSSNFASLDVDTAVTQLKAAALSNTFQLNEAALNAVIEDCKNELVYPLLRFDGSQIKDAAGQLIDWNNPIPFQKDCIWFAYRNLAQWDSVRKITYDPKILEIAKKYLGNNAIVRNQSIWWSFPAKGLEDENFDSPRYWYHYDIDDFKFLKIFIYLNDVDSETGPHIVVKNTHKSKPWKYKLNRSINNNKINGFFEDKEIIELTGKKGTSFLEDTFTYHNGTPPKKPRLVLQVEYSLTNLKLG